MPEPRTAAQSGRNWRDLRARLLSAAVLVPLAGVCIWLGGPVYGAMVTLAAVGMAWEAGRMFGLAPRSWRGWLYLAWPAVAVLAAWRGEWTAALGLACAAFIFGPWLWMAMVWIVWASVALLWLRLQTQPAIASVVFVIVAVIASDSGAYLAGRLFGGPKLAPRISPAKTWSGSAGGLVCAAVAGALVAWSTRGGGDEVVSAVLHGAGVGGLLGIGAQSGDLAESAIKRRCGVKDSSALIPGHGGLLDRFDGLLVAAPLAAALSLLAPASAFWYAGAAGAWSALTR
ncbi:CDP-archaeol synthase [Ameyamaea chiangmaiensis]|uniref:Phosphatidate cytidylyltransferase n=1 Tax=Ameyamaea chiangmaiensis TaxID=442969 RepID=A0A850P7A6_9PROT|nr:CDP-archaeol synthase [Ameyamaea chiangmaiensis]MBS4074417.1 CDP-archaeol synthase [Ameyamaea chiangmaiensis]NVN40477.1 CDP-archaeol synthase [Ameyamaea chiangmaiensis]